MLYLKTFDFLEERPASMQDVRRTSRGITLRDGHDIGYVLSPPFNPRLAYRWKGYEVWGEGIEGVEVAFADPDSAQNYGVKQSGTWIPVTQPHFLSSELARRYIESWQGAIQMRFRLRRVRGVSPVFRGVRIGYFVDRNLLIDVLEFSLPKIFSGPLTLSRIVPVENSKIAAVEGIELPGTLVPVAVRSPLGHLIPVSGVSNDGIILETPTPLNADVNFVFQYRVPTYFVQNDETFQLERVPCILIKLIELEGVKKFPIEEIVQSSETEFSLTRSDHLYDARAEITVFALTDQEARQIADQLQGILRSAGCIHVPQHGLTIPIMLSGTVSPGPGQFGKSDVHSGALEAVRFMIRLLRLPGGSWVEVRPSVGRILVDPISPVLDPITESPVTPSA